MRHLQIVGLIQGVLGCVLSSGAWAHGANTNLDGLPLLKDVAADAVQISPHVPRMGEHWARPGDLPVGPIYCVIEGRVTCVEYMFMQSDLQAGRHWNGLSPKIATPPISHVDVDFKPNGVEGLAQPLYQVHLYFASPDLLAKH